MKTDVQWVSEQKALGSTVWIAILWESKFYLNKKLTNHSYSSKHLSVFVVNYEIWAFKKYEFLKNVYPSFHSDQDGIKEMDSLFS